MYYSIMRAWSSLSGRYLMSYIQMHRRELCIPASLQWLAAVIISTNLLSGCAETVDNKVIDGLATTASMPGRVDESTIRILFGLNEANYTRVAVPDEYGSYNYRAVGKQPLSYVGVDNLPHYAGGGANQQQISVGLPDGTCITPDMVKNQTGRPYGSLHLCSSPYAAASRAWVVHIREWRSSFPIPQRSSGDVARCTMLPAIEN
jgi:hypothetical protein